MAIFCQSVEFFLTPLSPAFPTSVFPFFPILIVKENLCNTLGLGGIDLLGSLELVRVDLSRSLTNKVGDFQNDCAGVRHWIILVASRSVRKMNYSIEVGTSEVRVLTFGLSPLIKLGIRYPRKKERKKDSQHRSPPTSANC